MYFLILIAFTLFPATFIAPDGFPRSTTLAGGTFPGPLIKANKGDHFAINVVNKLDDGSMFTSTSVCPIVQNHLFLHAFDVPNQTGTYWYHSHYSTQQCDGLRGPLVIYDPNDPLSYLYDVDDDHYQTTVISIADWYHIVSPILRHIIGVRPDSTLINGLGRYISGPKSELAVVNVEYGKRYRLRLAGMFCDPSFKFSIDGHNLTVIETDGHLIGPLLVDSLQSFARQRYSIVLIADKPVNNYWLRAFPSTIGSTFIGGLNSAILRYRGAPIADPTTDYRDSTMSMLEMNLHPLINPVLLQILNGAHDATDLMSIGSVIVLEANKVVELTVVTNGFGAPHPIHLHGHAFDVVQLGGASGCNYINTVRRCVVSSGTSDNSGPWFLHCEFAIVMAESPSETRAYLKGLPPAWEKLCPTYYSSTSQLGAVDSYAEAANITTLLLPITEGHLASRAGGKRKKGWFHIA
ncbi:Cupredoxin [Suillus spraguei]|nr:Cupredoxin [Suillus spraguei]